MIKKRKRLIVFGSILILFSSLMICIVWGNKALELNSYYIVSEDLPKSFEGFRIAQVSDLHNAEIGKDNQKLISTLKEAKPNIIVITGDMIDSRNTKTDVALCFAKEAVKIAPCYYITGNHEARASEYSQLKKGLLELGVTVLEDDKVKIELLGETITLFGVLDPRFNADSTLDDKTAVGNKLDDLIVEEDGYTILLSHRPELFETYVDRALNLVFSGHAHGGQFRLPFVGGIIAPNQGLFPKYDAGIYTEGNTNMVVSRGVGNSIVPFRVNNRPEIVLVELNSNSFLEG